VPWLPASRVRGRRGARRRPPEGAGRSGAPAVSGRGGRNPRRARPEPPHPREDRPEGVARACGCGGEGHAQGRIRRPAESASPGYFISRLGSRVASCGKRNRKGGLAGALQMRLDAVEARGGLKADLQVQGTERLTPLVRQELYQIAQEALNNALKHARAGGAGPPRFPGERDPAGSQRRRQRLRTANGQSGRRSGPARDARARAGDRGNPARGERTGQGYHDPRSRAHGPDRASLIPRRSHLRCR